MPCVRVRPVPSRPVRACVRAHSCVRLCGRMRPGCASLQMLRRCGGAALRRRPFRRQRPSAFPSATAVGLSVGSALPPSAFPSAAAVGLSVGSALPPSAFPSATAVGLSVGSALPPSACPSATAVGLSVGSALPPSAFPSATAVGLSVGSALPPSACAAATPLGGRTGTIRSLTPSARRRHAVSKSEAAIPRGYSSTHGVPSLNAALSGGPRRAQTNSGVPKGCSL
jgi:hypothetical protein